MNWQAIMILQTLLVGSGSVCLRVLARDKRTANASFAINGLSYVALYASMLVVAFFMGHVATGAFHQYFWRFILGGTAFAITNIAAYKTLVYFDVAIASIAGTLNAIFCVVGASLVLDEMLSVRQLVGASVLVVAIAYGVLATHTVSKQRVRRSVSLGTMFVLIAAVSYAVAQVNEKSLLSHMSAVTYMVYGVGGQCLMSVVLALAIQPKQLKLLIRPHVAGWSLLSGVLRGLGGACFILSEIKSNNVGLVSVIANFRLIVAIFLGAWLLEEHQYIKQKLASAAGAIGALSIMFWK